MTHKKSLTLILGGVFVVVFGILFLVIGAFSGSKTPQVSSSVAKAIKENESGFTINTSIADNLVITGTTDPGVPLLFVGVGTERDSTRPNRLNLYINGASAPRKPNVPYQVLTGPDNMYAIAEVNGNPVAVDWVKNEPISAVRLQVAPQTNTLVSNSAETPPLAYYYDIPGPSSFGITDVAYDGVHLALVEKSSMRSSTAYNATGVHALPLKECREFRGVDVNLNFNQFTAICSEPLPGKNAQYTEAYIADPDDPSGWQYEIFIARSSPEFWERPDANIIQTTVYSKTPHLGKMMAFPSVSPDGSYLVWSIMDANKKWDLYLWDISNGGESRVIYKLTDFGDAFDPDWAPPNPDGSARNLIAYTRSCQDENGRTITNDTETGYIGDRYFDLGCGIVWVLNLTSRETYPLVKGEMPSWWVGGWQTNFAEGTTGLPLDQFEFR